MNDPAPLPDENVGQPGSFSGLSLSARQRRLFERLVDLRQPVGTSLGQMYLGALVALDSRAPDALAHAAHSSRELIEKILLVGDAEKQKSSGPRLEEVGKAAHETWGSYRETHGVGVVELSGQTVDPDLLAVLVRLDQYREAFLTFERFRRDKIRRAMGELALGDVGLPEAIREQDVRFVQKLWGFFDQAAHHRKELDDPDRVREAVQQLEGFLMRLVPETFADKDEIDAILGGADA